MTLVCNVIYIAILISNASIFYRKTIKWFKDGDCFQAPPNKWASDYLSAIILTHSYVLCNLLFQAYLLWSSSYCKLIHFIGNHNALHQVTIASCALLCWLYILISVMDKLPATSYVRLVDIWLIFVQLYPFIEENLSNNVAKIECHRMSFSACSHRFQKFLKNA